MRNKYHSLLFLAVVFLFNSCCQEDHSKTLSGTTTLPSPTDFIPKDSANKMINSYLSSLDTQQDNLQSLVINMDQLRLYDTFTGDNKLTKIKVMFAHTMNYINTGHGGQNAGYRVGALTVIIAGVNSDGNYVLFNGNGLLNHSTSCPHDCPPGTAAGALIP